MTRKRASKLPLPREHLVPIANDGLMAGPVADGRQIPVFILDTTTRPDVDEMIRVHTHVGPGDVRFQWALVDHQPNDVVFLLEFERPVETKVVLRFGIEERGGVVDLALVSGALYLQAGRLGDRLIHDLDRPKILVELPDAGFRGVWERTLLDRMTRRFARETGLPQRKAREMAREFIGEWRRMGSFRMPQ